MESSPRICNINPLPQFYVVGDLSGGYSQLDHKFNFNTNVNVTTDSHMNRSFNFSFSQFPLIVVLAFLKVKIRKALCVSTFLYYTASFILVIAIVFLSI